MVASETIEAAGRKALAALEARLGDGMGVRLPILQRLGVTAPGAMSLASLIANLLLIILVLVLSGVGGELWQAAAEPIARCRSLPPDTEVSVAPKLVSLLVWGSLYFTAAGFISTRTTRQVVDIVEHDILPFASARFADAVRRELEREQTPFLVHVVPAVVGVLATGATIWALANEPCTTGLSLAGPSALSGQHLFLGFWALFMFYLYFTAARAVVTATLTRIFAGALDGERESLYLLDAAGSPLVVGLAQLNRAVLTFWAKIFVVIASAMVLVVPPGPFDFAPNSPFLFTLIPVAGFFSIGVGSLVYLDSESTIAAALRRFTLDRATPLQVRINELLADPDREEEAAAAKRAQLAALHDRIVAGGRYGSRTGTAVSLALPFAMPVIGLLDKILF